MTKFFVLPIAVAMTLLCGPTFAQQKMPDSLTNCHTPGAANQAGKETTGSAKDATGNAQDVEKSAILPDAGGEGTSAAPTVQRDGKSVEARTDCPDEPKVQQPKG